MTAISFHILRERLRFKPFGSVEEWEIRVKLSGSLGAPFVFRATLLTIAATAVPIVLSVWASSASAGAASPKAAAVASRATTSGMLEPAVVWWVVVTLLAAVAALAVVTRPTNRRAR